jgi:N-methylhydantoinase A/oxoprolinase/acetone carboxylase beta subunit
MTRDQAFLAAQTEAKRRAEAAGGSRHSLKLVELEDIPLSYLPGDARRVRVRMVGDIGSDD